jgi:hypothetical protein
MDEAAGGPEAAAVGALIGGVKALFDTVAKSFAEQDSIRQQTERLNVSATNLSRAMVEFQTQHAMLLVQLPARYPSQDWSFLLPTQPRT